ncbi:MAG: flippase-like domain-containing protein, partial [Staphylothermus sp.]|nr:flippase-like domain-containing protein [Staphylothermus sp.]
MDYKTTKVSRKSVILVISLVTIVIIGYSIITGSFRLLEEVSLTKLILSSLILLIAWLISAYRLKYIHRILDPDKCLNTSIKDYFYARLLGGLMAYVTPSAIGGEPARAYYLAKKCGGKFSRYFALSIYEVYYDIMIVNILALILSFYSLPYSLIVIIVSAGSILFWIIMYHLVKNIIEPENTNVFLGKIINWINKFVSKRLEVIKDSYFEFANSFNVLVNNSSTINRMIIVLLTFLYHVGNSLAIFVLAIKAIDIDVIINTITASISAYFYSLALGALPSPGGAGVIEYGLSLTLAPEIVVVSRTLMYYSTVIIGLVILYKIGFTK